VLAACGQQWRLKYRSHCESLSHMKKIITSILIGVLLYFLFPIIGRYIPHHHLLVMAVSAGLISYLVSSLTDRFN
jgi:uncharacterized membrane protein (DUF106 family)